MNTLTESNLASMSEIKEIEPVVEMEDVSVLYRVPRERVSGIKEYTIRWLQRKLQYVEFWALHGVSFHVNRGEVFGVIGRNGSGKSTMLKVMARVLRPSRGHIITRGKVAPLLELGAGFHPELTGRENIYLNSALLGFTRKEAQNLEEEIIDFSGVREFIDAPLRTYSTGMVARLGFAVATSKRPEILLVDEVLSVGDGPFQEKCLERIGAFRTQGTTIIIVSHGMGTIQSVCQRALWLDHGQIRAQGDTKDVVEQYTHSE